MFLQGTEAYIAKVGGYNVDVEIWTKNLIEIRAQFYKNVSSRKAPRGAIGTTHSQIFCGNCIKRVCIVPSAPVGELPEDTFL